MEVIELGRRLLGAVASCDGDHDLECGVTEPPLPPNPEPCLSVVTSLSYRRAARRIVSAMGYPPPNPGFTPSHLP